MSKLPSDRSLPRARVVAQRFRFPFVPVAAGLGLVAAISVALSVALGFIA